MQPEDHATKVELGTHGIRRYQRRRSRGTDRSQWEQGPKEGLFLEEAVKMGGFIGDTGDLELGRTSGDRRLRELSYSKFSQYPTEARMRLYSIPLNSTNPPTGTDIVTSSHCCLQADDCLSIAADSSSLYVVGSGKGSRVQSGPGDVLLSATDGEPIVHQHPLHKH